MIAHSLFDLPPPNAACEFPGTALSRASLPMRGEMRERIWRSAVRLPVRLFLEQLLHPFALDPAFPGALVGRHSHDYSGCSVAIQLALHRPSQLPLRSSVPAQAVGVLFVPCRRGHSAPARPWEVLPAKTTHQTPPGAVTSVLCRQMAVCIPGDWDSRRLALTLARRSCRAHPPTLSFAPA